MNVRLLALGILSGLLLARAGWAGEPKSPAIFRVVTRELPTRFSPGGTLTDFDRMAHDLLFEPLVAAVVDPDGSIAYRPALAETIPVGQGTQPTFRLRSGALWSNGEPIAADDVRRAVQALRDDAGAPFAWSKFLGESRQGASAREIVIPLRHGLIEPWQCFTFPIAMQKDDTILGSGPFVIAGPLKTPAAGVRFTKNHRYPSSAQFPVDEIHWFAATNAKDAATLNPDLALGFESLGQHTVKVVPTRRVWFIAPNHRHPLLTHDLRTFLAISIDRDKIIGANPKLAVNGLTPRDSWAHAPAPRIRENLHQPEIARGLAAKLAGVQKDIRLSLKFPFEQTNLMKPLIEQWQTAAAAGGLNLKITPIGLNHAELAQAIAKHDFELALVSEDHGDSPLRLAALFNQNPAALAAGGSNFMGVDDAILAGEVSMLPLSRQFPTLRDHMRNIHVQLMQTMSVIPLWQHQTHIVLAPGYRSGDPLRPFAELSRK